MHPKNLLLACIAAGALCAAACTAAAAPLLSIAFDLAHAVPPWASLILTSVAILLASPFVFAAFDRLVKAGGFERVSFAGVDALGWPAPQTGVPQATSAA